MRDFFSLDGSFHKYGSYIADTLILSLMWILFSLPVITMGAATSAAFYVSTRRIAEREGYITSDFWHGFKASFKRATVLWVLLLLFGGVLVFNVLNLEYMEGMHGIMLPAQLIFIAQLAFISVFLFPVTARFDMSVAQTIKSSFFMANRHLLTSILCTAILVFVIVIASYFYPLFFLAPGAYAMASSYLIMRVFKRYRPEMDKDPRLEIQEIEAEKAAARRRASFERLAEINAEQSLDTNLEETASQQQGENN